MRSTIIIIIGLVLIAGCAKEEKIVEDVQEQPVETPQETQQVQEQPVEPSLDPEKEKLLDRIDWSEVQDKTIVLFVRDFGSEQYMFTGEKKLRLLIPIKNDFEFFLNSYNHEYETLERNGKTLYTFTEKSKRDVRLNNGLDRQPQHIQDAYERLLDEYPNLLE